MTTRETRGLLDRAKSAVRSLLARTGYEIRRAQRPDERYEGPSFDVSRPVPPEAADALKPDHPRLIELQARYARLASPLAARSLWRNRYLQDELSLSHFRGDNPYVWQFRNVGALAREKYYFFLRDVATRDSRGLLRTLTEDGLFGCWTFDYPGWPRVSRDLLDSVNELLFLDRHLGLLDREGWTVLDVGAGYGRLAHRTLAAAAKLGRYVCVDAVPESTFLCEFYLRYRGCGDRAEVVPLDELDPRMNGRKVELAINVHSFSEMTHATIDAWLAWLSRNQVEWLFIVPNDGDRLLSMEDDGQRIGFRDLLGVHGYELKVSEPVFADPTMREFMNVRDHFFLFRRSGP